jgi:hypothetical protein
MGNSNSGRFGGKIKCEHCLSIDVRRFARSKLLDDGAHFTWRWDNGSMISVSVRQHSVTLHYGIDGVPIHQAIELRTTDCQYGGERAWFICPCCHERRANLFLRSRRFACRTCQRLRYHSQSLDPTNRQQRAYHKAQSKLLDGDMKPKGMHWRTFERLHERMEQIDAGINASFALAMRRFMKRYGGKSWNL